MTRVSILNFQDKLPVNCAKIKKAVFKTLAAEKTKKKGQITVCLIDDKTMRKLNTRHMHRNGSTDVLSFSLRPKGSDLLADIAVSAERAIDNAKTFSTAPIYEMYLYIVHGTLHALGYDDKKEKGKKTMADKASKVLNAMNISYAHT